MAGIEAFFEEQETKEETVETEETTEEEKKETTEETTESEEETSTEETTEESTTEETEDTEEETISLSEYNERVSALMQMLRESNQKIQAIEQRSQRLEKLLSSNGHIDDEALESLGEEKEEVADSRNDVLTVLAETMRLNPAFSDFDEVCSQENCDLVVQTLAQHAVKTEGGSLTEKLAQAEQYVWGQANPYKFVYDVVKQYHPKYSQKETGAEGVSGGKQKKTAVAPPTSVSKLAGGGASGADGWTAAKIDALSEDQLHTVPEAVYQKYMRNELK